jgi:PST family polysaccharide transporter
MSTVILARLLVPSDFVLVAMATSVVAFLELATAFSFDVPLIQNQYADRRHFDAAWTLNLLFYAGLTALLILLARPAAAFYHEPRLSALIYVLAAGFFVRGFENIGVVNFRKELNFRQDFLLTVSKKVIALAVTLPAAFYFRSYWALAFGIVASNVFGVALTYVLHSFRPRFSLAMAGEMLDFSKWLILNNAFGFLRLRSPDFVVGRISGTSALGLFNVAFEISTLPTTELVAPINRAVFPGYAKLAANLSSLRESYLDVLAIVAFVALPAGFGISAVAAPLVDIFLGSKWVGAVPLVQVLAIFGAVNAIQTNSASVFNAKGKPYLIALMEMITVALLLGASIPLGAMYGPIGVSLGYLAAFTIAAPITFCVVCREIESGLWGVVNVLWRPIAGSCVMYGVVTQVRNWLTTQALGAFEMLLSLVLVGAVVYAIVTSILWWIAGKPVSAEYRLGTLALRKICSNRSFRSYRASS